MSALYSHAQLKLEQQGPGWKQPTVSSIVRGLPFFKNIDQEAFLWIRRHSMCAALPGRCAPRAALEPCLLRNKGRDSIADQPGLYTVARDEMNRFMLSAHTCESAHPRVHQHVLSIFGYRNHA